jgi:hypothetical protein
VVPPEACEVAFTQAVEEEEEEEEDDDDDDDVGGGGFAYDNDVEVVPLLMMKGVIIFFPILVKMICTGPCHHFTILKLSNRCWFVRLRTIITSICVMMM